MGEYCYEALMDDEVDLIQSTIDANYSHVRELLKQGVNANAKGDYGMSALHWAFSLDLMKFAKLLIDNGADVDVKDQHGRTPLHFLNGEYGLKIAKFLFKNGANPNVKDKEGKTPLHHAHGGAVVKLLIENGAAVDAKDEGGMTRLHQACSNASEDILKLTLNGTGANAERLRQISQETLKLVKLLVENGADPNVKREFLGHTPLHTVCGKDQLEEVAKFLIESGADVNAKNIAGWTPLHWASSYGQLKMVKLLLSCGAKRHERTNSESWIIPIDLAQDGNHQDVIEVLERQSITEPLNENLKRFSQQSILQHFQSKRIKRK